MIPPSMESLRSSPWWPWFDERELRNLTAFFPVYLPSWSNGFGMMSCAEYRVPPMNLHWLNRSDGQQDQGSPDHCDSHLLLTTALKVLLLIWCPQAMEWPGMTGGGLGRRSSNPAQSLGCSCPFSWTILGILLHLGSWADCQERYLEVPGDTPGFIASSEKMLRLPWYWALFCRFVNPYSSSLNDCTP